MAQLYFYYSSMNAGKSTHLLQSSYNYQERGLATAIFVAWVMKRDVVQEELNLSDGKFTLWYITLRWFTPIAVLFVFLNLIGIVSFTS